MTVRLPSEARGPILCALIALVLAALASAPALAAPAAHWNLSSSDVPANLAPGSVGEVVVAASNFGDAETSGEVIVTDELPAGLKLVPGGIHGYAAFQASNGELRVTCEETTPLRCHYNHPLLPANKLKIILQVEVVEPAGTETTLENKIAASGGGLSEASVEQAVKVSEAPATFGVEKYSFEPEEEDGTPDARAGSHPFQLTTTLALDQNTREEPVELPKTLQFDLPPGLIGNPLSVPRCTQVQFSAYENGGYNACPADTAVGVAEVTISEPQAFFGISDTLTVPVFNVAPTEGSEAEPTRGEPARLGLVADNVPVILDTAVRTGSDYGVVVTAHDTSELAGVLASNVTIWGVPSDPAHDSLRGWQCTAAPRPGFPPLSYGPCKKQVEEREQTEKEDREAGREIPAPKPFLSLPTACGTTLKAPMQAQSWTPGASLLAPVESEYNDKLESCAGKPGSVKEESLSFAPTVEVTPDETSSSTPTGLGVNIKMPIDETAEGLEPSAVRSTTFELPKGVQLNPAAAGGLEACTALQMGFLGSEEKTQVDNSEFSPDPITCPEAAEVGTVEIESPDLENPLKGFVYLASEDTSPFQAPLVTYIVAKDPISGVLVKLAGTVTPTEGTGQVISTFENTPQVPFKELKLHFFGGPRASLSTPELCGSYESEATFTPWSGDAVATAKPTPFVISSGPGGGPCSPTPQNFAPSFSAGSTNPQAGAFSNFTLQIGRPDGQQALTSLSTTLPAGLAAVIGSVTQCPIEQAEAAACGEGSLIGHTTSESGFGPEPYSFPGTAYLTGPYDGAPFGLSVVTPAVAGPFNLGTLVVDSTIQVNPTTAAVTVTAVQSRLINHKGNHPIVGSILPTIVEGAPVQLKAINVTVDRPNFQFNPTSCTPQAVTGTLGGSSGASFGVSSPFQVANCASLPFAPKLTATTGATASKLDGITFKVKVESAGIGQANISKVFLTIPAALPSRLPTLQKACIDSVFNSTVVPGKACSEESIIGSATIHTPVINAPFTGPAYLVSHGAAEFPDVEFVLKGEGILIVLDGKTDIKNGITYSRFEAAPDAPFTSFETELPAGPHGVLTAYTPATPFNVCKSDIEMPTEITGQNGAVIKQETHITAPECGAVLGSKTKVLSAQEKLTKALKACRTKYAGKKHKKKRQACEKQARKKYAPKKKPAKKTKKK